MSRRGGPDPVLLLAIGAVVYLASRPGGLSGLISTAHALAPQQVLGPRRDTLPGQTPTPATTVYDALFDAPPPGAPPMPSAPPHPGMLGSWALEGGPEPFNMSWVWVSAGSVGPS